MRLKIQETKVFRMEEFNDIFDADEFVRFVDGDPKAFQCVFDFYFPIIYRYTLRKDMHLEDAEDIVQEAFTLLFLHRSKVQASKDIYPYLFVITKRLCISFFRKRITGSKTIQAASLEWSSITYDVATRIDFKELQEILHTIIDVLPPQQQEIYRRFKLDDQPQLDIAAAMGLSRNTVKNHLQAASKSVRLHLQKVYTLFF